MVDRPISNGPNGGDRDPRTGCFAPGNQIARGRTHPVSRRVKRLRAELLRAITPHDIRRIVEALIREAEGGNVAAAKELLNRALGPAEAIDLLERLELLEALLGTHVEGSPR